MDKYQAWVDRPIITSPLGFIRPSMDAREDENLTGLKKVDKWFFYCRNNQVSDEVRGETVEYAYELFSLCGSVEDFLRWNFNNAKLSANKRRFINDTLRFIQTGKRRIDVATYWALIHHDEGNDPVTMAPQVDYELSLIHDKDNMLSKWISHEGGFMDLLWTLRILFGSPDTTKDWN